jgi:imidazole glycerol-phosphate synthase subunit HisH
MVSIIEYGMGNVASVEKALAFLKIPCVTTADHEQIEKSDAIILPGVGSFEQGMKNLMERNLVTLLTDQVIVKRKKFLGICLGMQLIATDGEEPIDNHGLGWIKGQVTKIRAQNLRVPHMGWNNIEVTENGTFLKDAALKDFYFIHSYHFIPDDKNVIAATVNYGTDLVAAVQQNNIFATQFHPEKSQEAGLALLKSFFNNA